MSVNLSPRQLLQAELRSEVASALRRHAVEPCALKLELTETALMKNTAVAQEKLGQLRDLGIGLSLDDFGTGYSSLAYLHRFPFHTLKIDRSFVNNLNAPTGAPRIVRTILGLARSLELDAVAEGIEREHDVAVLINLGCRYGQGYFFSPPVPAEVAEGFLRADRLPS
jgi:EAL domain-containing protein (putative c-di-GMP-specific phosphodiesterase class I)